MKKPRLPKLVKAKLKIMHRRDVNERIKDAFGSVPRITNETIAEHREEVLSSARKYIYPLSHSRNRLITISLSLLIAAIIAFLTYCGLALYRFQSTSGFIYDVSLVLPFPVAKAGPSWVSYESYLFQLRHYIHYYQTQDKVNFSSIAGKQQLQSFKNQALTEVIDAAYVKQLARAYHVTVTPQAVDNEVSLVESENRLGSNPQELENVLKEFWGWNLNDFKRELQHQMLAQAVVAKLDISTNQQAQSCLKQLQSGADFATLAKQLSEDTSTKNNGGQYPGLISVSDPNISPQVTAELLKLKPGQISSIINTGYALEIVKVISVQGSKVQAAHIVFNFKPLSTFIAPLEVREKPHQFIEF